jgi:aspartyl-tRNA(Asn)/glutamyl-tRNA(Gln) amidotransferase subunit A
LIAYASSFDQIGIFGNTVDDIALLFDVMGGPDEFDSTVFQDPVHNDLKANDAERKYRIAYFEEALLHPSLDKEIKENVSSLIDRLRVAGHTIVPVEFDLLNHVVPAYYVLTTAEASSNLSRYDGIRFGYRTEAFVSELTDFYKHTRNEGFGKEVQRRIMLGTFVLSTGFYDAYYSKAQQVRRLLVDKTAAIFSEFDAVIMPVSPTTAFEFGAHNDDPVEMYLADIYTVFANLTGLPGIALPLFKHSNGMPFGVQVMTNKQDDVTLLRLSRYLMEEQAHQ